MKRILWLWLASLVFVAVASFSFAQGRNEPRILSGADVGVRLDGVDRSGKPTGTIVVRVNGQWVDVSSEGGPRLLGK